jgi:hypothetical protein
MADPDSDLAWRIRHRFETEAQQSPPGVDLLSGVHARSRQLSRRRRRSGATVVAVSALAAVSGFLLVDGPGGTVPVRVVAATAPPAATPATTTSVSVGPATQVTASTGPGTPATVSPTALTLTSAPVAPVVFPYLLDPSVADLMRPNPTVTLVAGVLRAAYEAKDGQRDADITLTVSPVQPAFPPATAPVHQAPQRVRGHDGVLRTVDLRPAAELTLTWQEQPGQWVQLRTDDTYRDRQVVRFAEGLTPGQLATRAPFGLDLSPAGAALTTLTGSAAGFGVHGPDGAAALTLTLLTARPLTGEPVRLGDRVARLSTDQSGTHLQVVVPDRQAVLQVSVRPGYTLTTADLIRFTTGVRVAPSAIPTDTALDG